MLAHIAMQRPPKFDDKPISLVLSFFKSMPLNHRLSPKTVLDNTPSIRLLLFYSANWRVILKGYFDAINQLYSSSHRFYHLLTNYDICFNLLIPVTFSEPFKTYLTHNIWHRVKWIWKEWSRDEKRNKRIGKRKQSSVFWSILSRRSAYPCEYSYKIGMDTSHSGPTWLHLLSKVKRSLLHPDFFDII